MTVYKICKRKSLPQKIFFEFESANNMLDGIRAVFRLYPKISSSLYKINNVFRLVVVAKQKNDFGFMNEFCNKNCSSPYEIAYTEEYGMLITKENAVKKIGKAFFKKT